MPLNGTEKQARTQPGRLSDRVEPLPVWTSHQDDERAYVLWGDRLPADALGPEARATGGTAPLPIGYGDRLDWAMGVAASVRVEVI